ncbi:MAG TPA: adenylate kinase [Candidatus Dormibacteraeota bacterium]|nr:adenylate kinase [Candidatus Dormibacteraeota bacterium]
MIGVIFGPPGSGKGTQASRIEGEFNLAHLSTGEILRTEASRRSEVGLEAARIMAMGDLVPDELIIDIVERRLRQPDVQSGVLLDGFPRTVEQAKALDAMLAKDGRQVDFVIALDVPEKLLVERIIKRAAAQGRADDTQEAITERMHEYKTLTAAVLDYYRTRGVRVLEIDGVGDLDSVFERIRNAMNMS